MLCHIVMLHLSQLDIFSGKYFVLEILQKDRGMCLPPICVCGIGKWLVRELILHVLEKQQDLR